jgi:hypothetical protein
MEVGKLLQRNKMSAKESLRKGCCEEFEPKREEVKGGWRKMHNVELHNLYSLPSLSKMIKSKELDGQGM